MVSKIIWNSDVDESLVDHYLIEYLTEFITTLRTNDDPVFPGVEDNDDLYLRIVSGYRDPDRQKWLHHLRMASWDVDTIMKHHKINRINAEANHANAIRLVSRKYGWNTDIEKKAQDQLIEERIMGENTPVLPGEDRCADGCKWRRSSHTYDKSLAVDLNVVEYFMFSSDKRFLWSESTKENLGSSYKILNDAALNSGLIWGMNFTDIPVDPVHFEVTTPDGGGWHWN